jgi:hypothetical protein
MKKINGPDLILALTAAIKSRNRISRFRGSCCQVNWTFQSPDPRFSDEASCRASPGGARSLPRVLPNGRSRSRRDFETFNVPILTTLRTPISRWLISRCSCVGTSLLAPEAYLPRSFCRSDGCRRPCTKSNGSRCVRSFTAFDHSPL